MKVKLIATLVSAALMTACSSTDSNGNNTTPNPELPVSPEMVNPIEDGKPGQGPDGIPTTPDSPVASNPIEGTPTTPDFPVATNPIEGVPTTPDFPVASNPIEGVPTTPDLPITSNPIEGVPTTPDLPIASNPIEGVPTTPDMPIASNPIEGVPTTPDMPVASNPIEGVPTTPDLPTESIPNMPTQGEHDFTWHENALVITDANGDWVGTAAIQGDKQNGQVMIDTASGKSFVIDIENGKPTIDKPVDMPTQGEHDFTWHENALVITDANGDWVGTAAIQGDKQNGQVMIDTASGKSFVIDIENGKPLTSPDKVISRVNEAKESMTMEQKSNLRRKVSQIRDAVKARLNR
ncbi:hypothetical protein ACFL6Z_01910 [Pseudomonadota bacterium]